ncbi:MAG: hypothetical protein ACR2OZ_17280 [Verrucomicrobiales bacterium]
MKRKLFSTLGLVLALISGSCSSFQQHWSVAIKDRPAKYTSIEGPWVGTWKSEPTGHSGALRCLVGESQSNTRSEQGALTPFYYRATWQKVLSGTFRTVQPVREVRKGEFVSEGDWTLPKWAGGKYHYRINATPAEFRATYRGGGDHGRFEMQRPR